MVTEFQIFGNRFDNRTEAVRKQNSHSDCSEWLSCDSVGIRKTIKNQMVACVGNFLVNSYCSFSAEGIKEFWYIQTTILYFFLSHFQSFPQTVLNIPIFPFPVTYAIGKSASGSISAFFHLTTAGISKANI